MTIVQTGRRVTSGSSGDLMAGIAVGKQVVSAVRVLVQVVVDD